MVEEAAEKYEDSIQSYLDAASIFEELGETELATFTWQALSKLQLRQKDWINAIASYERGIANLPDNSVKKKIVKNLLKAPGKFM
jgi:tetratricopeptide (TPR) repeat protein